MVRILICLFIVIWTSSAEAQRRKRITVTVGKNAVGFHFNYQGQTILVDLDGVHVEHDWHTLEDMISGDRRVNTPVILGRTRSINNAFAFIHSDNKRYVVLGTDAGGITPGNILVLGHEVGHHLCGHTVGMMRDRPVEKELDADRVAGVSLRPFILRGLFSVDEALGEARRLLPASGSTTHPDVERRIAAIRQGIETGQSPCLK